MSQTDTIIAIVTPPGRGGVGILRISGLLVMSVAYALLGKLPCARQAEYLSFRDKNGVTMDKGIALFFPRPHSFTGEDVLELQGHGGPVILDLLLQRILLLPGLRIAHPGEFSQRAFLNEKLDLTQAEAIADLINANSVQAAKWAINSLQGEFSKRIHQLVEALTHLRIYVEATIDFPDDSINFLSNGKLENDLKNVMSSLHQVRAEARQSIVFDKGIKIVIAGKPNSGKSSLLNVLSRKESAIVTAIAGTTRDVLHEHIYLDGISLHIIDTAGLRSTDDEIEKIGINRAWNEIQKADHVLLITDCTITPLSNPNIFWPSFMARLPPNMPVTVIRNKADITNEKANIIEVSGYSIITLSAKSKVGINLLLTHLKKSIGLINSTEGGFLARRRHLESLEKTAMHLLKGTKLISDYTAELLAEELRLAQQALNEITGEFSSNDLLEKIFSNFCIGK